MPDENGSRVNQGYKPLANNVAEAESEFDMEKKHRKITPEVNAGILSKWTFSWFTTKLEDACDHVLELDEYYELPIKSNSPEFLVPFFDEAWKTELNRKKITTVLSNKGDSFDLYNNVKNIDNRNPSLVKALYHCFKKEFYSVLFLVTVSNLLITIQILLIRLLLTKIQSMNDYFADFNIENETNTEIPTWALLIGVVPQRFNKKVAKDGIFIVMIMTIVNILFPVFRQQETRLVTRVGRNVRSLMTGVVYRKVLKMDSNMFRDNSNNNYCGDNDNSIKRTRLSVASILSENAANNTNGLFGNVVNLLSNDVSRFSRLYNSHEFYSGIVSIIISLFALYFVLGVPGLAGMLIMGLHIVWSIISLNYRFYERKSFSEIRDKRILLTSEYLSFIKIIKSYSWEESFVKEINKYRINEISSLLFQGIYWSLSTLCHAVVLHSTLITILTLKYMGKKIDPANIFFALVFYDAVSEVVISFPKSYALFRDLILSCERIKEFLLLEDKEIVNKHDFYNNLYCSFSKNEINSHSGLVCYNNVELRWKDGHLLLNNLNFKLKSGELMGIIGPVGCGKSGLLASVVNEIIPTKGSIGIKGSTAYVPQLAWIFTGTIRENIIFGSEFNQKWYDQVISACSLTEDFELFPNGDQTVVGGKDNSLSGGQKQRISLARAVYKNSQIYVLDDCLSAVDSNVSSQIFKNCITGLLKNKCVILATHLLNIVPYMDYVLLLDGSKKSPTYSGDPKGLAKISEFRLIFEDVKLSKNIRDADTSGSNNDNDIVSNYSNNDKNNTEPYFKTNNQNSNKSTENIKHISLEEDDVEGIVTLGTYVKYMLSYNKYYLIGAISFGFISTLLSILINFYVGYWAEHFYELEWRFYFGLFASLSVIFPIVVVTTTGFFKFGGLNVSNTFHDKLLKHIENAPLRFFDNTPIGRILNRFTSDLVNVDELLPTDFNNATIAVITCGIILISTGFITPQFFVCLPILFYAFYCVVKKYPPILRQAERRSAALSAPITSHTIETIMGLTTIHTFNTEDVLTKKLDDFVLLLSNVRYHVDTACCWLNLRLEIIASITLVFSGTFGVLLSCCNKNYAGIFGTILSFAVTLPGWLRYTVFTLGEFEADMVGFERIRNYTDSGLFEVSVFNERNPDDNNGKLIHPNWPEKGRIEFKNVCLSLDQNLMNYILKNISFNINHGERVGIVGRTGAGKSSLFTMLLRLYNPSNGNILIDGVDTASIPVRELRNRISIVPQDPIIFTGSIRFNLDPNNQFTDDELYNVLKRVHIYDYVMALPDKLDHFFVSGGGTLSIGIKQLFCLARAVLKRSKILLLDEATSFIDIYTDSLIQETISKEFKDSTTITIAHRIKTVINYDKIMVLDSGKIIEFNSPEELLNNPNSTFKLLASSTI
ncbi:ABC ATpase [Cryptosporidium xiaoi]|uniref:ABC ATpase n=1 Tax=Cryptosporidium xiaoi TaxID=659607 RepID=A0AAV9XY72_9CRYT